jgi:SEC-C motif domain protein
MPIKPCPCWSGLEYVSCCGPYHAGEKPASCLNLMRARYSAYALGLIGFILNTTHPHNIESKKPLEQRRSEIISFCNNVYFLGVEITHFEEKENFGRVIFKATLEDKNQNDLSFIEESTFEKVNGEWLYLKGNIRHLA